MKNPSITDQVKSFADACTILKLDPSEVLPYRADTIDKDEINTNAFVKLKTIIKALNEGWYPDFSDTSEYKYYPWFRFDKVSGFGFSGTYSDGWFTDAHVGSRLVYRTEELAEYAGKQFIDIYNEYLN